MARSIRGSLRARAHVGHAITGLAGGAAVGGLIAGGFASVAGAHFDFTGCSGGNHQHMSQDPYPFDYSEDFNGNNYGWASLYGANNWNVNTEADFTKVDSGTRQWLIKSYQGSSGPIASNDNNAHLDSSCGIIAATIVFNTHYTDGYDLATLTTVSTHEQGHTVGFYDIPQKNCAGPLSIMFSSLQQLQACGITGPTSHDASDADGYYN